MATIDEQQKLIDTLKFTPRTYTVQMWGYGGERAMGTVDRKIFDYFKHRRLSVSDYAWDSDYAEEHNIPEEYQPFPPGSWYECDNMGHISGVARDAGTIQVTDENGETVYERSLEDCDGCDDSPELYCEDEVWLGARQPGEVVFIGRSNEKGTFFEGKIELTAPFDITKLGMHYDEFDGEDIVSGLSYDGEDIDNDGYGTDGKSSDFDFFLLTERDKFERYRDADSIEYPTTEWFSNKVNPVYVGNYEIETPGKNSYKHQARWTGSRWISSWQDDTDKADTIKIKQWRGIPYNPDADVEWDPAAELDKIMVEHQEVIEELKADPRGWPY